MTTVSKQKPAKQNSSSSYNISFKFNDSEPNDNPDDEMLASATDALNISFDNTTRELKVRLDRWLWAARFYKTRALAIAAVTNGKVYYNDKPATPTMEIQLDGIVQIGHNKYLIKGLSTRRRNSEDALDLYEKLPDQEINQRKKFYLKSRPHSNPATNYANKYSHNYANNYVDTDKYNRHIKQDYYERRSYGPKSYQTRAYETKYDPGAYNSRSYNSKPYNNPNYTHNFYHADFYPPQHNYPQNISSYRPVATQPPNNNEFERRGSHHRHAQDHTYDHIHGNNNAYDEPSTKRGSRFLRRNFVRKRKDSDGTDGSYCH